MAKDGGRWGQGIIHRDFKTNNCFVCSPGIVKLGDFGISKVLSDKQQAAKTMVGTPYYMSPEALKVCFPLSSVCNGKARRHAHAPTCARGASARARIRTQRGGRRGERRRRSLRKVRGSTAKKFVKIM